MDCGPSGPTQINEIQRFGEHLELAIGAVRPLTPRPVVVELDAVAIRISKIEGLAHTVVRRSLEWNREVIESPKRLRPLGLASGESRTLA